MRARETQQAGVVSDVAAPMNAKSSDLIDNNLAYVTPAALSLAVDRKLVKNYFQSRNYVGGETAVIDFNSGTDYVDGDNSCLTFCASLDATATTATAGFGKGSAMNFIKSIKILSRSGIELDRVERANFWSQIFTVYTNSHSFLLRQGPLEGWNVTGTPSFPLASNTILRYAIPLKRLSGLFRPTTPGQKIPPNIMSGMKMEIEWENVATALLSSGGAGTINNYKISELCIITDNITMTDDVQKTLNQQSATNGLEYVYPRWFHALDAIGIVTAVSTKISKSVAMGNMAIAMSVPSANAALITQDSFISLPWNVSEFNYRLGALFFPSQPIRDPRYDAVEAFQTALMAFNKYKHPDFDSSVSYDDFKTGGRAVMAVSLERDAALELSGLPLNNSRLLELLATEAPSAARNVYVCLEYTCTFRAYVDNVVVSC